MEVDNGRIRGLFFKNAQWRLNRCLAPGLDCTERAIHAHSVQNAHVMGLLARNGHVKAIKYAVKKDDSFSVFFKDVGRNQASTFEGFCRQHDTSLFLPIDTRPLDPKDTEQLFLFAYRSVARETHAVMEGAIKMQSAYQDRVSMGLDTGLTPEPAGMTAVGHIINAHSTWEYKARLDEALLARKYDELSHDVLMLNQDQPCLAVSSCFTLEDRPRDDPAVRVEINAFPIREDQSAAIFSYTRDDTKRARDFLRPVLEAQGDYQKYLLSKLILMHCENVVISPAKYDRWADDKKEAITAFFMQTLYYNVEVEDQRLFLF